jgi:hypothetical protein
LTGWLDLPALTKFRVRSRAIATLQKTGRPAQFELLETSRGSNPARRDAPPRINGIIGAIVAVYCTLWRMVAMGLELPRRCAAKVRLDTSIAQSSSLPAKK